MRAPHIKHLSLFSSLRAFAHMRSMSIAPPCFGASVVKILLAKTRIPRQERQAARSAKKKNSFCRGAKVRADAGNLFESFVSSCLRAFASNSTRGRRISGISRQTRQEQFRSALALLASWRSWRVAFWLRPEAALRSTSDTGVNVSNQPSRFIFDLTIFPACSKQCSSSRFSHFLKQNVRKAGG
jgi:hypothetical protein